MLNFQKLIQYCIDEYNNSYSLLFKGLLNLEDCITRKSNYAYVGVRLKTLYETLSEDKIKNHRDVSKYYSYSAMKLSSTDK
jgi:hypothetical protein